MEAETNQFIMYGVREVMPSEALHIETIVNALEQALSENLGLAFDLSKTLIETACKTIIKERGQTYNDSADLPKLIKSALDLVCIIPDEVKDSNEAKQSLKKNINGIMTSIQGICELRRLFGEASHGRDANFKQLEIDHALMVARSADVIVNYLFRMNKSFSTNYTKKSLSYNVNSDFNDWIDEQNDAVRIFELVYKPSEVLFNTDRVAYQNFLSDYESDGLTEENPTDTNAQGSNSDE